MTVGGDRLTLLDLPRELREPVEGSPSVPVSTQQTGEDQAERARILKALKQANGNRLKAAKLLGYSRVTLWKNLRHLGISTESSSH